jgi:hypothetical protein
MDAPICHLTIAPWAKNYGNDTADTFSDPSSMRCIGSRCSAWTPKKGRPDDGRCGLVPVGNRLWRDPALPPGPPPPAILSEPAWQALSPLSTRTYNALRASLPYALWGDLECSSREVTVGELCECTDAMLLKMRNFARRSLNEVKDALDEHGLRLSTYAEWEARRDAT